jgi:hypothetical protein
MVGRTLIGLMPAAMIAVVSACNALPIGGTRPPSNEAIRSYQSSIPLCRDIEPATAPDEYYRETPIYVGNEQPTERIRKWAQKKPGFQEIWIDRDHNGWVTVAFNQDTPARQAELEEEFPGVGVVAVQVDWTKTELEALQQRVGDELMRSRIAISAGSGSNIGAVSIGVRILDAETIAAVEERFAGDRVCLEGLDPAHAPVEGPQQQSGNGWRLLADEDETGWQYRTGIAYDEASYEALWLEAGISTDKPPVDFASEVVIWFGAVHGSSCPRLRLDGVVSDQERGLVHSEITKLDFGACTADAIPHAYVVAFARERLPVGPFAVQLQSEDPPRGVLGEERTIVEVDLSAPGSTAGPREVHHDNSEPEQDHAMPGDIIETGFPRDYRQSVHCGLEWLGPLNDVNWRTDDADAADWIPDLWQEAIVDGEIRLELLMTTDPPKLKATANGHSITYDATADEPPGCD